MLEVTTHPHIEDSEIARLCGQSVLDDLCDYYEVKNGTSESFCVLTEEEIKEVEEEEKTRKALEEDEDNWFNENSQEWKLILTKMLLENGFKHGDKVYIDFFW